jgi:nitrate reductase NapE component
MAPRTPACNSGLNPISFRRGAAQDFCAPIDRPASHWGRGGWRAFDGRRFGKTLESSDEQTFPGIATCRAVLAVGTVGGYGLGIWIYQMFTGPPGPPPKAPRPPGHHAPIWWSMRLACPRPAALFSPANGRLPIRGGKPPAVA